MEITLSKWFFDGVMDKRNVLAISPLYFEITSGLGKWLYRASRKHAGGNGADGFVIGFETLHQKSGSESSYPVFKRKLLDLARANELPDISPEVVNADSMKPKMLMVMRRHMAERVRARRTPLPSTSVDEGDVDEMIDPRQAMQLIAQAAGGLRSPGADRSKALLAPVGSGRANEILEPDVHAAIRSDFQGWDYDELMRRFDAFLGANPHELPRNYSKRFYGFVKEHHCRNKYRLRS